MNKTLLNKILLCLLLFAIVGWIGSKLFLVYLNKTYSEEELDRLFEPITLKYGITIVYEVGEDFFSDLVNPTLSAGPSRRSKVTPIRHRVLARYPRFLEAAFEKYPVRVIKKYLNAIHFAGEIDDEGFRCGGSYDRYRKVMYLVDHGWQGDDHPIYTIHHEFSSLLLARHSFFLNPWTDQNPKDFKYLYEANGNLLEIYDNASLVGTEADYAKGFMNTYGQTDFENDFNEYSAMIFTYPQKFRQIMDQYPRVRGKFLVWLDFYRKIDPIFTEEYLFGQK